MKKRLTRGEKWLFASPLLLLIIAGVYCQWRSANPYFIEIPKAKMVTSLAFSPEGNRLAIFQGGPDFKRQQRWVYDLASHSKICELAPMSRLERSNGFNGIDNYYTSPSWSPDGNSVVAGSIPAFKMPDKIAIWDAESGDVKLDRSYPTTTLPDDKGKIRFSPDGKSLVGEGIPPAFYNAATGQRLNKPAPSSSVDRSVKSNVKLGQYVVNVRNVNGDILRVIDFKTKRVLWQPQNVRDIHIFSWDDEVLCLRDTVILYGADVPRATSRLLLWDGKTRQSLTAPIIPLGSEVVYVSLNSATHTMAYTLLTPVYADNSPINIKYYKLEVVVWDYQVRRELWRTDASEIKKRDLNGFGEGFVWYQGLQWSPDGRWLMSSQKSGAGVNQFIVFNRSGQRCFERKSVKPAPACWSSDSKRLAVTVVERDNTGKIISNRVEIQRFED